MDWQTDDTIDVALYNPSGTLVATTSASDSTYTSGGYGLPRGVKWRLGRIPGATIGRHRTNRILRSRANRGGATFASPQSSLTSSFNVGDVARLRVAIENTGLELTGQEYRIEYAAKGSAPELCRGRWGRLRNGPG